MFTARCALNSYIRHGFSQKGYASRLKMGGELEILLHVFLTSALDGDKLSVLRSGRINPEGNRPVPVEWKVRWT